MAARKKEYQPKTEIDIKILILFLLDNIRYPVAAETLRKILYESVDLVTFGYDECLDALVTAGHVLHDEVDGVDYYMVSSTGRALSAELYDSLDSFFREKSLRAAAKYMALTDSGTTVNASVEPTPDGRFAAVLTAKDASGEILSLSVTVNSKTQAEAISANYLERPDSVYRGVMFSVTGRVNFLS